MARVVPSQVRTYIERTYPWATSEPEKKPRRLDMGQATPLAGLLDLVEQLPPELITVSGDDYTAMVEARASIRTALSMWYGHHGSHVVSESRMYPGMTVVGAIYRVMKECHDDFPAPGTAELTFIADAAEREALRRDLGGVGRALSNGEWKAATVLAGSLLEALLLWALRQRPGTDIDAARTAITADTVQPLSDPGADLTGRKWTLVHYIGAAAFLGLIKSQTKKQAELAKDYRNLIHPAVEIREQQECSAGTAMGAVAAVHLVILDLTP
jgi:hypothetical protein